MVVKVVTPIAMTHHLLLELNRVGIKNSFPEYRLVVILKSVTRRFRLGGLNPPLILLSTHHWKLTFETEGFPIHRITMTVRFTTLRTN